MSIWYAFATVPQREFAAEHELKRWAVEVFVPIEYRHPRVSHHSRSKAKRLPVPVPMLRGYVFATFEGVPPFLALEKIEDPRGRRLLRGVVKYSKDGLAAPIKGEALDWLKRYARGEEKLPPAPGDLDVGAVVYVWDGPFRDMRSKRTVERVRRKDGKRYATILMRLFNSAAFEVEFEVGQLEAAA